MISMIVDRDLSDECNVFTNLFYRDHTPGATEHDFFVPRKK